MAVLTTIIPVFTIIILGWIAREKRFITQELMGPANRLVFYFAIPAMIFQAVSKSSFNLHFHPAVVLTSLAAIIVVFALAWLAARCLSLAPSRKATFVQSAIHGNLGYIGLAVAYFFLGPDGLVRAGILAGFMMVLQNFLAVIILQRFSGQSHGHAIRTVVLKVAGNPVILSAAAGITASLTRFAFPQVVDRSLTILSGMALPLALLLIGASISLRQIKDQIRDWVGAGMFKLMVLPALGLVMFRILGIPSADYLPALILLACPSATLIYTMAGEMNGDLELAVITISASTLLSALSLSCWLGLAG